MTQDARHARYLQGERGVTLHALPNARAHAVMSILASEGKLMALFREHVLGEAA
jgi:hypothetical protein